jgi:hypothetical protein
MQSDRTSLTVREFREAVYALSADPGTRNISRYLAASRALDDLRVDRRRRDVVEAAPAATTS